MAVEKEVCLDGEYSEVEYRELLEKIRKDLITEIETLLVTLKAYSFFQTKLPAKLVALPMFLDAQEKIGKILSEIESCKGDLETVEKTLSGFKKEG